ncbi:MAG: hypothetical protein LBD31_10030 [Treponema sp.]|jgi:hypothetical protein|nr:hypothetical protein [Treponema sp.]
MKKRCIVLFLLAGILIPLPAATISVLVIETGLPPGMGATESASVWESGLMDAFFDAGHIVSNAPILRLEETPGSEFPPEVRRDFDAARIGGSDFFVMVLIKYRGVPPETEQEEPREITIKLFSVSSGKLIYEMSAAAKAWGSSQEAFLDAKRNAGYLIPRLSRRG